METVPIPDPASTAIDPDGRLNDAAYLTNTLVEKAQRVFRGSRAATAEFAAEVMKELVSLDGGCDAVLLVDDDLETVLRRLPDLQVFITKNVLTASVLLDVTVMAENAGCPLEGFERVSWTVDAWDGSGGRVPVEVVCKPEAVAEIRGRWFLTLSVSSEVQNG